MLYQLHELHRAIMSPIAAFTDVGSKLFSHPASPLAYTPGARQFAAGYELIHRIGKKFEKPQWQLPTTDIDGESVAVIPEESTDEGNAEAAGIMPTESAEVITEPAAEVTETPAEEELTPLPASDETVADAEEDRDPAKDE